MNLEDRKGVSSVEQQLRQENTNLKWEIDKLKSDLRYAHRKIDELRAIKDVK